MDLEKFLAAVILYCFATRASVTSWIRTKKRNANQPGSVLHSGHLYAMAVDVEYDDGQPADGADTAERLGLKLIRDIGHDHLQPLEWRAG